MQRFKGVIGFDKLAALAMGISSNRMTDLHKRLHDRDEILTEKVSISLRRVSALEDLHRLDDTVWHVDEVAPTLIERV